MQPESRDLSHQKLKDRPTLYQLKDRQGLIGCEVGVAQGDNAMRMFKFLDINKLYLVDPYVGYWEPHRDAAYETLKSWDNKIVWIHKYSYDVSAEDIENGILDFVYIDAEHDYKNVLRDITHFFPKVKTGGIIGGHDWAGGTGKLGEVAEAVMQFFDEDIINNELGGHDWDSKGRTRVYDWWVWK